LLENIEQQLVERGGKATLADYIRLVQLRREMEGEEAREIRVQWVEPAETDSGR
jgi:hypothetical protein